VLLEPYFEQSIERMVETYCSFSFTVAGYTTKMALQYVTADSFTSALTLTSNRKGVRS
jgi:hypothetical protein